MDRDDERQMQDRPGEESAGEEDSDTEGHGMFMNPILAQDLQRSRAADVDRRARERQRRDEGRQPNNRRG